jgi:hypothetical protein
MKVTLTKSVCIVEREPGDRAIPSRGGWANDWHHGESVLLHRVKTELNRQGGDYIKKRMWKDGHLVDDHQQYIRSRSTNEETIGIYNDHWAIRGAEEDFNAGRAELAVVNLGK